MLQGTYESHSAGGEGQQGLGGRELPSGAAGEALPLLVWHGGLDHRVLRQSNTNTVMGAAQVSPNTLLLRSSLKHGDGS